MCKQQEVINVSYHPFCSKRSAFSTSVINDIGYHKNNAQGKGSGHGRAMVFDFVVFYKNQAEDECNGSSSINYCIQMGEKVNPFLPHIQFLRHKQQKRHKDWYKDGNNHYPSVGFLIRGFVF